jgi:hypothetical protein
MKPKYIYTMVEIKIWHPDTNRHFWVPRFPLKKMQVQRHGEGIYLRGVGGGIVCKLTHQNSEWTFFEKINAIERDFKDYRIKTTEYKRLMEK